MQHAPHRRGRLMSLCLGAAMVTSFGAMAALPAQAAQGKILHTNSQSAIDGRYIVVLQDAAASGPGGVEAAAAGLVETYGGEVRRTYEHALRGFSVSMSEAAAKRLAADPNVKYVEQNQRVHAFGTQQDPPSYGLDRIDQRDLPLDDSYTYPNEGSGVTAYVIDTGTRISHNTFEGRASNGYDFIDNDPVANDCNGHGTHVAGTIGGQQYGVAKDVEIVAVRVLNCRGTGSYAGVIDGIDWVTRHADGPSVANMSLGGPPSNSVDDAIRSSIASGVTYGIAAGNANENACNTTPARVREAITVGATDRRDNEASYSNYGPCLDIYAPGSNITSAWNGSDTDTNTISGTSMATPHVVGAAALVLSANPSASPAQVRDTLVANATEGTIDNIGPRSPNKLLHVGGDGNEEPPGEEPPGNSAPTASFTTNCFGETCTFDASGSGDSEGNISSFEWSFGDGSTGTGRTVTHRYSTGGALTVTLTVTDDAGATDSASRRIQCYAFGGGQTYCFA